MGVIDAYRIVKEEMPEVQLALVGSMATDDPEGWEFFNSTMAYADGDPDIHILNNLNSVGAIEVNAFQSQADVVIQKSTREGFGLTVSEALWKGRPFIGGDVGGIPLQVQDGADRLPRLLARRVRRPRPAGPARARSRQAARPGRQGARAQALPHAPPAARLAQDLHRHADDQGGRPRPRIEPRARHLRERRRAAPGRRRARHGADRARAPPRRGLGRVDDDRGRRRGQRASTAAASFALELDGAELPDPAGRVRPGRLRPLLQRGREPDAVVHPALPLGPLERARHPPPRGRGLRAAATAWSTRTWRARCSRRSRASRRRS